MNTYASFAIYICLLLGLSAKANTQLLSLDKTSQKTWAKLMHYYEGLNPMITDSRFYLSKTQYTSIADEFALNLASFTSDTKNYSCQFPARSAFFSELTKTKPILCPTIEDWKSKVDAKSISLVYVSQYISNPASVFGHTFLIANSRSRPKGLSITINNAADMPANVSSYDYITKGLSGGYKAINYIETYTTKYQEYVAIENRDLWIYDLNLTEADVNQFLNHLWELNHSTSEDYYFLNKNCSAFLVNALAAVIDDIGFVNPRNIYYMPFQSVKDLKHRISSSHFVPSTRKSLSYKIDALSSAQDSQFSVFLQNPDEAVISNEASYLNVIIDYFDFKRSQQNGSLNEAQNRQFDQVLLQRSKIADVDSPINIPIPPSPADSFKTSRLALSASTYKDSKSTFLSASPLYHSLLQKEAGFIPFSEVVLLDAKFNLKETKLQDLTFIRLTNHPFLREFDRKISWTGSLFVENPNLDDKFYFNFDMKFGMTVDLKDISPYFLIGGSLDIDGYYVSNIEMGILFNSSKIRAQLFSADRYFRDNLKNDRNIGLKLNTDLNEFYDIELLNKFDQYNWRHELTLNYFY